MFDCAHQYPCFFFRLVLLSPLFFLLERKNASYYHPCCPPALSPPPLATWPRPRRALFCAAASHPIPPYIFQRLLPPFNRNRCTPLAWLFFLFQRKFHFALAIRDVLNAIFCAFYPRLLSLSIVRGLYKSPKLFERASAR